MGLDIKNVNIKNAVLHIAPERSIEKKIRANKNCDYITGDLNPLHYDDSFAKELSNGKYNRHVSFGMLTASLFSTMAGMYLPGKYSLIHSFDEISFLKPVFAGDCLTVKGDIIDKDDYLKMIRLKVMITNQDGKKVARANMNVIVMR